MRSSGPQRGARRARMHGAPATPATCRIRFHPGGPMRVGRWEIGSVLDGFFGLDGGAMFGVVPRPLWEKRMAPDARNRIRLASRCLVATDRDARRVVLVDVGVGEKWDARRADMYAIDRSGGGIDAGLARIGLARADVT